MPELMESADTDHQLLLNFLEHTDQPIFLTGKAGTGKTTLLRKIRTETKKSYAVVAPTAVAAINAGGVTLHSFFQIPFGPLVPEDIYSTDTNFSYSQEKTKLLKALELLIIDEISMVRVDIIDFIDRTLKGVKGSALPFGGVQVLMIGDLFQLSPIFHDAWHILKEYYSNPYFFDAQIFRQVSMVTFTLEKVYRQSDPVFLDILNGIRENTLSAELLERLNARYDADLGSEWKDEYITLTTHNNLVSKINKECLDQLPGEVHTFKAEVSGDFPKDAYPVEEVLELKKGAQVIFIKNDSSGKKQYYNGKAAKLIALSDHSITVRFLDDQTEIEVEREIWQNVKYNLNDTDQKIDEVNTGSFSQYPVKLAWAITIHKSQGLTFDKAIVDVSSAFAHGHAYVALSRCRSLEGLVLKSKVGQENIITDAKVTDFIHHANQEKPDPDVLNKYKKAYAWNLVRELFNFNVIHKTWIKLERLKFSDLREHQAFLGLYTPANDIFQNNLLKIADRFTIQELDRMDKHTEWAAQTEFLTRLNKASAYFIEKTEALLKITAQLLQLKLYNDANSEKFRALITTIQQELEVKRDLFNLSWESFSTEAYSTVLRKSLNKEQPKIKILSIDQPEVKLQHPQLHQSLMNWRKALAQKRNIADYQVLSDQALVQIAEKLPKSTEQLGALKSVGIGHAKELGKEVTKIINAYLGTETLF